MAECTDRALLDDWHAVAELWPGRTLSQEKTVLLGHAIRVNYDGKAQPTATALADGRGLQTTIKYSHIWICLGHPARDVVTIPELDESDRLLVTGGSVRIRTSGLRLVENFVDSAHFPFVHRSYLGEEPYTEVRLDECSVQDDGTIYSRCSCFQNYQPAGGESAGTFIEYEYRIYSPLVVALFKANGEEPARKDCVAQFVQAVDEETCIAHSTLAYLPHNMTEHRIRWYMQLITGQDKPILENQVPKRLPLNLRDEVSVRADGMSVAYRRRLKGLSIGYGAIVHP